MLKDLTKGNPLKVLLFFALPMFLSMIFQQMYNLADSIVAGNYGGVSSLGAISASTPVVNIFLAISIGGTLGCSVVISTLFGARDYLRMKTAVYTAIISLTIVAFICTLVGIFICRPLLEMLNTPSSLMDDATIYLEIYIFGFFFLFIYNIANSIFTGLGDSKTPLILLIISSVSNIFIDILFANIFKNVVEGVAWATFITQGIASIASMGLLIIRIRNFKVEGKYPFFNKKILKDMIRIAIPSIIQQSIVSVGQLMVQSLINSYGVETIDGYATAETEPLGFSRLALYIDKVGVCRNFADDITAKLNAINPEYNARNIVVYMSGEEYNLANIDRNIIETNETVAGEDKEQESGDGIVSITGNHMVTAVDVPDENITLILDPTNPGIGVFRNGQIYMFSTPDGKGIESRMVGQFFQGAETMLDLGITELKSCLPCEYSIEELEEMYGTEKQNEVLEYLEALENDKIEQEDFVPKVTVDEKQAIENAKVNRNNSDTINKTNDIERD